MKTFLFVFIFVASFSVAAAQDFTPEQQQELDYFQEYIGGTVYRWGDVNYPMAKSDKYNTFLAERDGDLEPIVDDPMLFEFFGGPLIHFYESHRIDLVGYIHGDTEVAVMVKIGDEYYMGFKRVPIEIVNLLEHHDRP